MKLALQLCRTVGVADMALMKTAESNIVRRTRIVYQDFRRWAKIILARAPFVPPPEQIQIIVTDRCNYRCPTCSKWHETSADGELTSDDWKSFLTRAGSMPWSRLIVFGGGEPLMRKDTVELIDHIHRLKLRSVLATNGSFLGRELLVELQKAGLDYLMVSLNTLEKDTHDFSRGISGSFEQIMSVVETHKILKKGMNLGLQSIIMGNNLDQILPMVDFVTANRLHGIVFQAYVDVHIHSPFRKEYRDCRSENRLEPGSFLIKDMDRIDEIVEALLDRQRRGARILNPPSQLKALKDYFRRPAGYDGIRCLAGVTGYFVDPYGNVRLCFRHKPIGNVLSRPPREIWFSSEAKEARKWIDRCRLPCRIMNRNY